MTFCVFPLPLLPLNAQLSSSSPGGAFCALFLDGRFIFCHPARTPHFHSALFSPHLTSPRSHLTSSRIFSRIFHKPHQSYLSSILPVQNNTSQMLSLHLISSYPVSLFPLFPFLLSSSQLFIPKPLYLTNPRETLLDNCS